MTKTYDAKCYKLAMYFLDDIVLTEPFKQKCAHELAGEIQQVIEDYLNYETSTGATEGEN